MNVKKKSPMSIEARGYSLPLGEKTYIMGILNVTPDSFSDGGNYINVEQAVAHAKQMIAEGADLIDVGGESTRPGSAPVDAEEEKRRILPVIEALAQSIDVPISVDTYKAGVAEAALKCGAHMINDVWGMQKDQLMAKVAAKFKAPIFIMHNQEHAHYQKDLIDEMLGFFEKSIAIGLEAGLSKGQMILDPGFGFGKKPEHNVALMTELSRFHHLGLPLLLGTSRKSTLGLILDLPPSERLEATLATSVMGVMQGVDFVRVHDVKEHFRALKVADFMIRGGQFGQN